MAHTIEIRIPAQAQFLKIIRNGISHLCEIIGFSEEDNHNITLAVDEACTNIIKHAYGGPTDKPIYVTCRILEEGLEVILRDFGKKADVKAIKSRQLEDVRPGGLGVHLIKSVMDVVEYDNTLDQGNQLLLIKYLPHRNREKEEGC